MNLELKALLERLGPVRDGSQTRLPSVETIPVALERVGGLAEPISIIHRLSDDGASMQAAHRAVTRLASDGFATCDVDRHADVAALAADLRLMNVHVRPRPDVVVQAAFEPVE